MHVSPKLKTRFYYYEKQDIDGLLILKEACLFDAKNLGNISPNGNDSFFNYVVIDPPRS